MKIAFPCRIEEDDGVYRFSFRDFDGLEDVCGSYEESLEVAEEILNYHLENLLDAGIRVFPPFMPHNNEVLIPVHRDIAVLFFSHSGEKRNSPA